MDMIFEIEPLDTFIHVFEDILINLYVSKQLTDYRQRTDLEPHIIQAAKDDMKKLIENSNLDVDSISKQLQNKCWGKDKVKRAVSLIEKRKSELLYATILQYNSNYGQTVQNFDWALKLIKGTNDLKTLNYPLLQLVFSIQTADGELKQSMYDVDKDTLKKIINVLENKDDL